MCRKQHSRPDCYPQKEPCAQLVAWCFRLAFREGSMFTTGTKGSLWFILACLLKVFWVLACARDRMPMWTAPPLYLLMISAFKFLRNFPGGLIVISHWIKCDSTGKRFSEAWSWLPLDFVLVRFSLNNYAHYILELLQSVSVMLIICWIL